MGFSKNHVICIIFFIHVYSFNDLQFTEQTMSTVHKICAEHDIDLDDESEDPPSQTEKDVWSDNDVDVENLIGKLLSNTKLYYFNA